MMRTLFLSCAAALLTLAFLIGGSAPIGRVALSFGMPGLAARLFDNPRWQGVAHYRAGAFEAAAAAFAAADPEASYNRGNAEAQSGAYAAALEAYDLAQIQQSDVEAQANFDLIRAFYAGTGIDPDALVLFEKRTGVTAEAPIARGSARAAGSGDEVTNTGAALALAELQSHDQTGVRRVFDDAFIEASPRWLATLEDVPGAFLAARISHEHKRREKAGIGQAPEDTEW